MPPLPGDVQWFPAEIRRLIEAVKKHEGLYKPRNEFFGLRDAQSKSWKSVAVDVGGGKTDTQCRDKWNCLRGTYRRHVRTEATNTIKRRSGWPWSDMMTFVKPYVMDREEWLEIQAVQKKRKHSPPARQTSPPVTKVVTHSSPCPMTTANKLPTVNISQANGISGLALAGGIYSGGFIFNRHKVGIGIVQPNQSVNIVQTTQQAMSIVQPSQPSVGTGVSNTLPTNGTSSANTDPIHVDINEIKRDPDAPKSMAFVDVAIKREPMDEDELQLNEFNFLPEDSEEAIEEVELVNREPTKQPSPEREDNCGDSNHMFMRSTVAHMRLLSAYDQSVFKLKVQQLLHDMMFPQASAASNN